MRLGLRYIGDNEVIGRVVIFLVHNLDSLSLVSLKYTWKHIYIAWGVSNAYILLYQMLSPCHLS